MSTYEGVLGLTIRQFKSPLFGEDFATKKGVTMTAESVAFLMCILGDIDDAVEKVLEHNKKSDGINYHMEIKYHIGEGIVVSVNSKYKTVDFRKYWIKPNTKTASPTGCGTNRKLSQWDELRHNIKKMHRLYFWDAKVCYKDHSHNNQMHECKICRPWGIECGFKTSDNILGLSHNVE